MSEPRRRGRRVDPFRRHRNGDIDGFIKLARTNAAKYNNSDYYKPGLFGEFVGMLGAQAKLLEIRQGDRLIGASVCLRDAQRFHFWACGSDYEAIPRVSPFYLAFMAILSGGFRTGAPLLEAGGATRPSSSATDSRRIPCRRTLPLWNGTGPVKALVKAKAAPGLWLEEVPDPRPAPDEWSSR